MKIEQKYWDMANHGPKTYLDVANKAIELQIEAQASITAEQARELGTGNAEWKCNRDGAPWNICTEKNCEYVLGYIYRAIKQAQPVSWNTKYTDGTPKLSVGNSAFEDWFQTQPFATQTGIKQMCRDSYAAGMGDPLVTYATPQSQPELPDPHATLRAEYAKQVAQGTRGFYLWECRFTVNETWQRKTTGDEPHWTDTTQYRCTDISCYVSKDGEPAIRMLRTEAQELQRKLGVKVEWEISTSYHGACEFKFDQKRTYNYRTKATVKLDGKMVTPEQAADEQETKKYTHELYYRSDNSNPHRKWELLANSDRTGCWNRTSIYNCEYELRTKQPKLKQLDWSRVPVGAMTNAGVILGSMETYCTTFDVQYSSRTTHSYLRLAPAPEQQWIAVQDDEGTLYEGLTYAKQYDNMCCTIAYKVMGLADGYTDGSDV